MGKFSDLTEQQGRCLLACVGVARQTKRDSLFVFPLTSGIQVCSQNEFRGGVVLPDCFTSTVAELVASGYLTASPDDRQKFEVRRRAYDYAAYRSKRRLSRWLIDCTYALGQVDTFGSRLAWAFGTFVLSVAGAIIAAKVVP